MRHWHRYRAYVPQSAGGGAALGGAMHVVRGLLAARLRVAVAQALKPSAGRQTAASPCARVDGGVGIG